MEIDKTPAFDISSNDISLTSFLELLGYTDDFTLDIESNSTASNIKTFGKCLAKDEHMLESENNLETEGIDFSEPNLKSDACSLESLKEYWSQPNLKKLYREAIKDHNTEQGRI